MNVDVTAIVCVAIVIVVGTGIVQVLTGDRE